MIRLLVVGFGPFPGVPRNPTTRLAAEIAADPSLPRIGVSGRALVLPTAYAAIPQRLLPALEAHAPDALLMLGVAPRRRRVCIETRAANRVSLRLPDAAGRLPRALAFRPGAPPAVRPSTPLAPLLVAARAAAPGPGAVALSRDAGRYLCNASYFAALAAPRPAPATVFVHAPRPREDRARRRSRLTHAEIRAILRAVAVALVRAARLRQRG